MDETQLAQLYQDYLGRAPDPSGIATWSGQDPSAVIAGILGSPEYQSSHPSGDGSGGGGGGAPSVDNMQPITDPSSGDTQYQYQDSSGGTVTVDSSGNPVGYTPGQSWYQQQYAAHPDAIRPGYGGQQYLALGPLAQTQTINGVQVPITNAYEYQINPNTKALTNNPVYREQSSGGLGDFLVNNGWMLPLAMAGGVAGAEFLPGLLGETGLGAAEAMGPTYAELGYTPAATGATTGGLMGPTYQELGYTGLEAGQMGPTYGELGYTGLNNAEAIAAADAAAAASGGLTTADLLKYGIPLAKLASGFGSGSGSGLGGMLGSGTGAYTGTSGIPLIGSGYGSGSGGQMQGIYNLTPGMTKASQNYTLPGERNYFNKGGSTNNSNDTEEHNPTFFSEGGLNSLQNTYVKGDGDGTSDSIAAMLADGEFVVPADVVSKLGNGSNDAGAKVLDGFLVTIRKHAQKHDPKELPPDSKGPLAYLLDAKKKVRA